MRLRDFTRGPLLGATVTIAITLLWLAIVWLTARLGLYALSDGILHWGTIALFFVGLGWAVWGVERRAQKIESDRAASLSRLWTSDQPSIVKSWNPLDLSAWYYGRRSQRYKQSMTVLSFYSISFFLLFFLLTQLLSGCTTREYELPAGGGQAIMRQQVKIQKVVKKKFVINPYSSILFNPPPLEQIDPKLVEASQHLYKVGQGSGAGAGFSSGTSKGKVRFIRLRYKGGDWDQDYGVGGDLNLLIQYGVRTGQKVEKKTEDVTPSQLATFKPQKSPPLLYLTGQKSIYLTAKEKKILKTYLLDRHGMIFGDNGGGRHFHNQFLALMREITGVREVAVPLDDDIHRQPYQIPFLPYVSPHGGKVALGWKVNGRWVAYYHPGDIGDAWADGHAGVKSAISEACYQLGVNVIFYAHAEKNKWLESQKSDK